MEFILFVGVFLLATTIGMCWRLELKQKDEYSDEKNKLIKSNQLATIFCGAVGAILTALYLIIQ